MDFADLFEEARNMQEKTQVFYGDPTNPDFDNDHFETVQLVAGYGCRMRKLEEQKEMFFSAMLDSMKLGNVVYSNVKNPETGYLAAPGQRDYDEKVVKKIAALLSGNPSVDKRCENYKIESYPYTYCVNVADKRLIGRKDGLLVMFLPVSPEAIALWAKFIQVFDGQHRALSFSDEFCLIKDKVSAYISHATIYIEASEELMQRVFYNMNFESKKISCDLGYACQRKLLMLSDSESMMFDVLEVLSKNHVYADNGEHSELSPLFGKVFFGRKPMGKKDGRISAQTICKFSCTDGKHERKDNLITAMNKCGKTTKFDIADAMNVYLKACEQETLSYMKLTDGRPFDNYAKIANPSGMKMSRAACLIAFAEPCLDILREKEMDWTVANIRAVLNVLFNKVSGGSFATTYKLDDAGNGDIIGYEKAWFKKLKNICAKMTVEELEEKYVDEARMERVNK